MGRKHSDHPPRCCSAAAKMTTLKHPVYPGSRSKTSRIINAATAFCCSMQPSTKNIKVVINGATKEIGKAAIVAVTKARGMEIAGAVDTNLVGHDAGKLCGMEEPLEIPILNDLTMISGSVAQVDPWKPAAMEAKDELLRAEEFGTQPRRLDPARPLRVLVARPKKSRSKAEKEQEVEVLQINRIEVDPTTATRFDVYVAAPRGDLLAGPDLGEFAGIFLKLPYKSEASGVRTVSLKLGLTSLLDGTNADDAEKLVVSLVLRAGDATVGDISIDLRKTDMARDM